ncbi:MAG: hypothetical protein L0387_08765 [Acidobacteria bacterium]|nr:hypothetical protein [Acidobacteriota bacterium]MCI0718365.1 hypothetical protein [Acidobacteriota bacterium]
MKPYLYILAVLLVGGGIGFFVGQRTAGPGLIVNPSRQGTSDDRTTVEALLNRQKEAYARHDELLLFRDCGAGYVEVNATTGEPYSLQRAIIRHHELFRPGKSVNFVLGTLDVSLMQNSALVRATYSKTSDQYEREGFAGLAGQALWLLSKPGGRWEITAFAWTEEKKQ